MTGEVPFVPGPGPDGEKKLAAAPAVTDGDAERARYRELKAVASEDKEIKELKNKADAETTDAGQRAASKAYYQALFKKIRSLDPSLQDHVDRLEKAMMKRLDTPAQ